MDIHEKLSNELLEFDFLSAQSKIEIWLCYKDLKPVTAFPIDEIAKIEKWLTEAELQWLQAPDSDLVLISKDLKKIEELIPIVFSNKREDVERKCILYGYPIETALAAYRNFADNKEDLPVGVGIKKDNVWGITWWPYVRYIVRQGHEMEDSLVAKGWSEVIKEDLPEIDKEFEKKLAMLL